MLGLGTMLMIFHIAHALGDRESLRTVLSGILLPLCMSGGVIVSGIQLWRQQMTADYFLRIAGWCLLGAIVLTGETGLTVIYQHAEGVTLSDQFYMFVNAASGGALLGIVVGIYDIRQRVAREESATLTRQLTVVNRVLRHDIRNSANVIIGYAERLADDSMPAGDKAQKIKQQSADLARIGDHARKLEHLLREDSSGSEPIDLIPVITTNCEWVTNQYPTAVVNSSLPDEKHVNAHPLVGSALRNVIDNAIEHNDSQPPQVTISLHDIQKGQTDFVELRIADNGPGIPAREQQVLERGYETKLEHTSGLGLWLVNWIVTESGGQIRFEENTPTGSVVCLRFLPASTASR